MTLAFKIQTIFEYGKLFSSFLIYYINLFFYLKWTNKIKITSILWIFKKKIQY